jgi:hypothetical protein
VMRGYQHCDKCDMDTRHENDACKVCLAKEADERRIQRELENLDTIPQRIEFMQREVARNRLLDREGRWGHLGRDGNFHLGPAAAPAKRGKNAKNIARILRTGKRRLAEAKAKGVDFTVLPAESKIRKRAEADWNRLINPPKPRGQAGRAARSKGKLTKREQAIELRGKGHTEVEIGKIIDRDQRTVRRYLTGR